MPAFFVFFDWETLYLRKILIMKKRLLVIFSLLFCVLGSFIYAQIITVHGTVLDIFGEPIPGAAILVKGTTLGAITDDDGHYSIQEVPSDGEIEVFCVGYEYQSKHVCGRTNVSFVLIPNSRMTPDHEQEE